MLAILVLVPYNIANNQYQDNLRVLHDQLLNMSPTNHIYTEIFDSEFSYIEEPIEIKDWMNFILVIMMEVYNKTINQTQGLNLCQRLCVKGFVLCKKY